MRTNQTSTDAITTKLTREESTVANAVDLKTTVDKAAGSCSQAFITERNGWILFFVGMKTSARTFGGLMRAQSPAAQIMDHKWAVMPIAEGILGSLERLSDSSLQ